MAKPPEPVRCFVFTQPSFSLVRWLRSAIAAGTRSAEITEELAPSEGCQSGPKGIAPNPPETPERTNSDRDVLVERVARAIWLAEENRARLAIDLPRLGDVLPNANWSKHVVAARAAIEAYEQAALSGSPEG